MTWAQDWRQDYIAGHLRAAGQIRRRDLMTAFGISMAQASVDLRRFQEKNPGVLRYDASAKAYVKASA
jgi:DeoR/GlpR family transcriptional regulator of sugar metabolism